MNHLFRGIPSIEMQSILLGQKLEFLGIPKGGGPASFGGVAARETRLCLFHFSQGFLLTLLFLLLLWFWQVLWLLWDIVVW